MARIARIATTDRAIITIMLLFCVSVMDSKGVGCGVGCAVVGDGVGCVVIDDKYSTAVFISSV